MVSSTGTVFNPDHVGYFRDSPFEFSDEWIGADRLELSQLISFPARWGGGGLVGVGGNSSPDDGDSGGGDTVWAGGGNLP